MVFDFRRPVVLGRKNWIHSGSPGGRTQGCSHSPGRGKLRRLKVPVRDCYFSAILPGLAGLPT